MAALMGRLTLVMVAMIWSWPLLAEDMAQHRHSEGVSVCDDGGPGCAQTVMPLFSGTGVLWMIWGTEDNVLVARSDDLGHTFAPPVKITPEPLRLDVGGDGRPTLIEDAKGRLVAAFAYFKDDDWNARAMVATSEDGGLHFSKPHAISDDPASQRFPVLASDKAGNVFAAWIDKRLVAAARAAGHSRPGASLAFAWSRDGGASFGPARIFHESSCECCRLALAIDGADRPNVLFRALFPGEVRDHGLIRFVDAQTPGPLQRVSYDNWFISGCPHHGPALTISPSGTVHAAWFTEGPLRQGLFYARARAGVAGFSAPMALSSPELHPARPALLAQGQQIWAAWKESDAARTTVQVRTSNDDGLTWSSPYSVADTSGISDHPQLASDGRRVYLSWLSHPEGYRLFPLKAPAQ